MTNRAITLLLAGWLAGMTVNSVQLTLANGLLFSAIFLAVFLIKNISLKLVISLMLIYISANFYQSFVLNQVTPNLNFEKTQVYNFIILDKPIKKDSLAKYRARAPDGWSAYLYFPRVTPLTVGSQITIEAKLEPIVNDDNYPKSKILAAKDRVFALSFQPKIMAIKPAELSIWTQILLRSRQRFDRTIQGLFSEPSGSLIAGIIVGLKNDIPTDLVNEFKTTGLSHIIAVSGFNITIVMDLFTRFTRRFGQRANFCLSWGAIIFFIFFTGASASVIRAGLLAGLFVLARTIGRQGAIFRLILATAVMMTVQNPLILRYDIGFQLSFMAMLGLVLFATRIETLLQTWPIPTWLKQTISATLAAQLTTTPVIIHYFHNLSLYSLPANILVVPLIPLLTIFGIPLVIVTSLIPNLFWLGYPFDLALRYIVWVVHNLANLPFAQLTLPPIPTPYWLYYYATLGLWFIKTKAIQDERNKCPPGDYF